MVFATGAVATLAAAITRTLMVAILDSVGALGASDLVLYLRHCIGPEPIAAPVAQGVNYHKP